VVARASMVRRVGTNAESTHGGLTGFCGLRGESKTNDWLRLETDLAAGGFGFGQSKTPAGSLRYGLDGRFGRAGMRRGLGDPGLTIRILPAEASKFNLSKEITACAAISA